MYVSVSGVWKSTVVQAHFELNMGCCGLKRGPPETVSSS